MLRRLFSAANQNQQYQSPPSIHHASSMLASDEYAEKSAARRGFAHRFKPWIGLVLLLVVWGGSLYIAAQSSAAAPSGELVASRRSAGSEPAAVAASASPRACSSAQAQRQARFVEAAKVRGCPSEDDVWLRLVHLLLPNARVFIDIGSNKGFTAARFFELWNPELGLDAPHLHDALKSTSPGEPELVECGACSDCRSVSNPLMPVVVRLCSDTASESSDANHARGLMEKINSLCQERVDSFRPIRVYSFDGNPTMIKGVRVARDYLTMHDQSSSSLAGIAGVPKNRLPVNPRKRFLQSAWSLELGAFSESYIPGTTMEFVIGRGEEGHLVSRSGDGTSDRNENQKVTGQVVRVPVLSIDHLLEREDIEHVDILKIDTEGHDPNVLRGAMRTIRNHRATLIVFEYNKLWSKEFSLQSVVSEMFGAFSYSCYLEGKNVLVKLTDNCWAPRLELKQWSNVWCVSLKIVVGYSIASVFDSYSLAFL